MGMMVVLVEDVDNTNKNNKKRKKNTHTFGVNSTLSRFFSMRTRAVIRVTFCAPLPPPRDLHLWIA